MNLEVLRSKNLNENDLAKEGVHPKFGKVSLRNLLATWVAHDLNHMSQINRVLANQYKDEVGPWSFDFAQGPWVLGQICVNFLRRKFL